MKRKLFFVVAFSLLFSVTAFSQKKENLVIRDPQMGIKVMAGPCTYNGLKSGIFSPWFNYQYKSYKPNARVVGNIQKKLDKTHITLVFGSWCGDSKTQVGRFYKILHETGYNFNNVKLIAVDRALQVPGMSIRNLHIKRIPTFIVYRHGKELGRIVESPKTTLEKDLQNILRKSK